MKGLILKDLLFIKNAWKNLGITYISSLILSVILNNYLPAICILPLMLTSSGINAFQTDEFYLTESYSLTLPIDREKMVLSRYLFTFILLLISLFIGFITYIIIYIVLRPSINSLNISMMSELIVISFLAILFNLFMYPIIYKYGCDKSKYVMTTILMILMCIMAFIFNIIDISSIDFYSIISYLTTYGIIIIPIVMIFIVWISYILSVKFFKKNDY